MFCLITAPAFVSHFASFVFMKESVLLVFTIVSATIKSICVDYKTNVLNVQDCQGHFRKEEKRKQKGSEGMMLNFIFFDALAPRGPLHYTFIEQMQFSLLSLCLFFFPLISFPHPPPFSASVWH